MNNKAEVNGVGLLLIVAVGIIVGLVLFQAVASYVEQGTRTNTGTVAAVNTTVTGGAIGKITELTGQELVGTPFVINGTEGTESIVPAANYSVYECVKTSNNLKGICYKSLSAGTIPANGTVRVSYTYYPDGYIDDSGGRSIAAIIILLAAVSIAMYAMSALRKIE